MNTLASLLFLLAVAVTAYVLLRGEYHQMMFRRNPTPAAPAALENRYAAAAATAGAALSVFQAAANDLELAATLHSEVRLEAEAERVRLAELAEQAEIQEAQNLHAADTIRLLFG